jgi:hypothetical protein
MLVIPALILPLVVLAIWPGQNQGWIRGLGLLPIVLIYLWSAWPSRPE